MNFLKELMSWHTKIILERHIANEPPGTPFFLYLSLQAIHDPHQASGRQKDAGGRLIEGFSFGIQVPEQHRRWYQDIAELGPDVREEKRQKAMGERFLVILCLNKSFDTLHDKAMITSIDLQISEAMERLRQMGLLQDTIVVFTSDV